MHTNARIFFTRIRMRASSLHAYECAHVVYMPGHAGYSGCSHTVRAVMRMHAYYDPDPRWGYWKVHEVIRIYIYIYMHEIIRRIDGDMTYDVEHGDAMYPTQYT
jgi:hypothetical protein